jgi:CDP-paratose 2-epimerase
MPEHILITGGAGFVGSSLGLSLRLLYPRTKITAFDNLRRRGSELNLPRLRTAGIDFVHGDVRCGDDLLSLPAPDLIIECSAEPSVLAGYAGSPAYLIDTNLLGCYRCLELARQHRSDFLFVSTSRVYPYAALGKLGLDEVETRYVLREEQSLPGVGPRGIGEDFPLQGPRSLYGMTKLSAELMVAEYGAAYGLRTVINRCGLLSGPWQMGKTDQGVVVLWLAAHYFQKSLRYIGFNGSGKQVRDVLAIEDLCELIADQVANLDAYNGDCFNVGGGNFSSVSLLEMTALCAEVTGNRIPVGKDPMDRPADIPLYISDMSRIEAVRGWRPRRGPHAVLSGIAAWIQENERQLRPIFEENFR